jgi:hypothetical protein
VVLENDPIMMSVCRKTNVAWIKPDEIHIWWTRTDSPAWDPSRMASLVSDDEKARADRFHFSRDQRRFIMVHGILRTILGYYLERRPVGLKFLNSPNVIADDSNQLWTVCPIHTARGYAAAFAVEGNSVVNPILRGCPPGLR